MFQRFFLAGAVIVVLAVVLFGAAYAAPVGSSSSSEGLLALWTSDSSFDAPEGATIVKVVGNVETGWPKETWVAGTLQDEIVVFPEWKLEGKTTIVSENAWLNRMRTYTKKKFKWYDLKPIVGLVDFATDGFPGSKRNKSSPDLVTSLTLIGGERGTVGLIGDGWLVPFIIEPRSMEEGTYYIVVSRFVQREIPALPFDNTPPPETPRRSWVPPAPFGDGRPVVAAYLNGRVERGKLFSADQTVYLRPLRQEITSLWVSEGICNLSPNGDWDVNPASMTTAKALRQTEGWYQLGYQPLGGQESLPIAIGIGIAVAHALPVDPGDQAPLIYLNQAKSPPVDRTGWFTVSWSWQQGDWIWAATGGNAP